jgi:antitoxin component of MazEF toxin-antitoxin module
LKWGHSLSVTFPPILELNVKLVTGISVPVNRHEDLYLKYMRNREQLDVAVLMANVKLYELREDRNLERDLSRGPVISSTWQNGSQGWCKAGRSGQ